MASAANFAEGKNGMISALYWREPGWLWLSAVPFLLWFFNRWWRQRQWQRIADTHLLPWAQAASSTPRQRLRLFCLLIGWALLCVAVAGPRSIVWIPPEQRGDAPALVFIVDLSASMNARDIQPNRRDAAQALITDWLSSYDAPLSSAIIVFAGHAFELSTLTDDHRLTRYFADSLSDIRLPTLGNNLPAALQQASRLLEAWHGEQRVIILSDGDMETSMRKASARAIDSFLKQSDLRQALWVGIGSNQPVSVLDHRGSAMTQHDRVLLTRLQTHWVQKLAQQSRLRYLDYASAQQQDLSSILQIKPPPIDRQNSHNILWKQWFTWPLLAATGFLLLALTVTAPNAAALVFLPLTLAVLLQPPPVAAADVMEQAQAAYQRQEYAKVIKLLEPVNQYRAQFERGRACYRLEKFDCAKDAFSAAVLLARNNPEKARAIFNLGNSFFFLGDYDQAAVLYRDAGLHGLDAQRVNNNLAWAQDVQQALKKHIQDIRDTLRTARWRADASGDIRPELDDLLADGRSMLMPSSLKGHAEDFFKAYRKVFQKQLETLLHDDSANPSGKARNWVRTDATPAQTSAALYNRLFEMESGQFAPLDQPLAVKGLRQW